jgi:hypothetical protein
MEWTQINAAIGVFMLILGVVVGIFRWVYKWSRTFDKKWDTFMRDWAGEPAAPGRDAVPGVMARLNNIDGELKHNGGSTMKDAMKRVEKKLDTIDTRLSEGNKRFEAIESEIEGLKKRDGDVR